MTTPRSTEQRLTDLEATAFRTGRTLADIAGSIGAVRTDLAGGTELTRHGLDLLSEDSRNLRQGIAEIRNDLASMRSEHGALLQAIAAKLGIAVPAAGHDPIG